ncbi:hypothetical protein SeMB42_g07477 [Synchytrium endobioticum]|uniref:Mitochondrial import inner membrane translocase subunit TIM50 n=1 Tax=Synchytrium endobioticum TaxID=286115 RepID=A0A507C153_9FUNG|nr:hypothetical protein SeMB42_g07477 [Synchytrium endobioticum]TPX44686.1 hypothetical protein SeLEV6574_g04337 [Synchytrium endobioticum]
MEDMGNAMELYVATRANMARPRPRLLIILDLNGTIIDRVKDGAERKLARANPHCPEPSFTSNAARIYIRPHLEPFLSVLFSNFTVAAWTSAQPKNAVPMARGVFGRHFDNLAFVWDRSHCSAVREGRKDHSSIKDVSKVWNYSPSHAASSLTGLDGHANQVIDRQGDSRGSSDGGTLKNSRSQAPSKQGLWTPNNTILIDDTPYKASYTPHNILAIPTFSVRDSTIDPKQDIALLTVSNYLLELKRTLFDPANPTSSVDVREYLKRKPLEVPPPANCSIEPHHTPLITATPQKPKRQDSTTIFDPPNRQSLHPSGPSGKKLPAEVHLRGSQSCTINAYPTPQSNTGKPVKVHSDADYRPPCFE